MLRVKRWENDDLVVMSAIVLLLQLALKLRRDIFTFIISLLDYAQIILMVIVDSFFISRVDFILIVHRHSDIFPLGIVIIDKRIEYTALCSHRR